MFIFIPIFTNMKALLLFTALLLANFGTTFSQSPAPAESSEVVIKVGTVLVYEVNNEGKKYQFIVTVKKLEQGITFDWQMTAPINIKGTLEMPEEAVENADGLFNYFTAGNTKLTTQTSVWISRLMWTEMHSEDEMVAISLDGGEPIGFFRESGENYSTQNMGSAVQLKTSVLKSLSDAETITVWENEKFPIILKMYLGWTIELKEIK